MKIPQEIETTIFTLKGNDKKIKLYNMEKLWVQLSKTAGPYKLSFLLNPIKFGITYKSPDGNTKALFFPIQNQLELYHGNETKVISFCAQVLNNNYRLGLHFRYPVMIFDRKIDLHLTPALVNREKLELETKFSEHDKYNSRVFLSAIQQSVSLNYKKHDISFEQNKDLKHLKVHYGFEREVNSALRVGVCYDNTFNYKLKQTDAKYSIGAIENLNELTLKQKICFCKDSVTTIGAKYRYQDYKFGMQMQLDNDLVPYFSCKIYYDQ